jgi:DNA-directed RNA polymerase subunit RPC12/RpoP
MENKKKMRKLRLTLLFTAIPLLLLEVAAIVCGTVWGIWWPAIAYGALGIPYAVWISVYYFRHVAYICPECHEVFRPRFKEAFFARHTPTLRRLTCPVCGHRGYCVETYASQEEKGEKKNG